MCHRLSCFQNIFCHNNVWNDDTDWSDIHWNGHWSQADISSNFPIVVCSKISIICSARERCWNLFHSYNRHTDGAVAHTDWTIRFSWPTYTCMHCCSQNTKSATKVWNSVTKGSRKKSLLSFARAYRVKPDPVKSLLHAAFFSSGYCLHSLLWYCISLVIYCSGYMGRQRLCPSVAQKQLSG